MLHSIQLPALASGYRLHLDILDIPQGQTAGSLCLSRLNTNESTPVCAYSSTPFIKGELFGGAYSLPKDNSNLRPGFAQAGSFFKGELTNLKADNQGEITAHVSLSTPSELNTYKQEISMPLTLSTQDFQALLSHNQQQKKYVLLCLSHPKPTQLDSYHGHNATMEAKDFDENGFGIIELTMEDDDNPSYFGQFEQALGKKLNQQEMLEQYLGHGPKYAKHIAQRKDAQGNPMPQVKKEPMPAYVSNDGNLYVMRDVSYATRLPNIQSMAFVGLHGSLQQAAAKGETSTVFSANTINAAGIGADGMPSNLHISTH